MSASPNVIVFFRNKDIIEKADYIHAIDELQKSSRYLHTTPIINVYWDRLTRF
ncbi:hypothetical protein NDI37_16390 [Funiculus sociatus GB2-A5]|uniref:Uncharacterized protein n=1 Tax=Funiculus sociatus GB2-A5 TaxID=2933946 RepID=A0ABV0JTQ4_9CYAN|nr:MULTISPECIES: hypothetical protein [unclassified Trichocoleus]MBD1906027.1 hypothetical protein [Trichocoleus sp. FACHB-832]MBD2061972.1 hypothetical protein [Trichocoleus sp. FACHB-6]